MGQKLKDLKVTKVDFVDAGANQDANIVLFKNKEGTPKGGENVEQTKGEGVVKRLVSKIAKALGMKEDEVADGLTSIAKGDAATFNDQINGLTSQRVRNEIWDVTDAYRTSLFSIIGDNDVVDKAAMMKQSTDEFAVAMKGFIDKWTSNQPIDVTKALANRPSMGDEELAIAKERAQALLKATATQEQATSTQQSKTESEDTEMKIDKSKLTPEEVAFYEAITKKAGMTDETVTAQIVPDKVVEKKAALPTEQQQKFDTVVKGLQAKLDAYETKELEGVAKKYEILGQKPEELVPLLKSMKEANPEQYNQFIASLDKAYDAVNNSDVFSEIGKRGGEPSADGDAWAKIEKKADEIRKAKPDMEYHEAIDVACQQNPELVHEYEANR